MISANDDFDCVVTSPQHLPHLLHQPPPRPTRTQTLPDICCCYCRPPSGLICLNYSERACRPPPPCVSLSADGVRWSGGRRVQHLSARGVRAQLSKRAHRHARTATHSCHFWARTKNLIASRCEPTRVGRAERKHKRTHNSLIKTPQSGIPQSAPPASC